MNLRDCNQGICSKEAILTYKVDLVKKSQQHTSGWTGGITTQIAIYPMQAEYNKHNFLWRLSTARVDCEESTFTALPGISRVLMVLQGEIRLEHREHHTAVVKAYEQDKFSGDWTTQCFGKASDFNLMMGKGCEGSLLHLSLEACKDIDLTVKSTVSSAEATTVFYCVDGDCEIAAGEQNYQLAAGDALLINRHTSEDELSLRVLNLKKETVHMVRADMYYKI